MLLRFQALPTAMRLGLALFVAGPLLAAAGSPPAFPEDNHHRELVQLLNRHRAEPLGPDSLEYRLLVRRGPEVGVTIYGILAEGSFGPGPEALLRPSDRVLLFELLRSFPGESIVRSVVGSIRPKDGTSERLLALEVIGATGTARSVDDFLTIAEGIPGTALQSGEVRKKVADAFAELVQRHPSIFRALRTSLRREKLSLSMVTCLVEVAGASATEEALLFLDQVQRNGEAGNLLVLEAIGRMPQNGSPYVRRRAAQLVALSLSSFDPKARQEAAVTLGKLKAPDYVETLIELLEDHHPRVRRKAIWALQEILGYGWEDPSRWLNWYEREIVWYEEEADSLIEVVYGFDDVAAIEALRLLSNHPLFRTELSESLAPMLRSTSPRIATAVCSTLARLDDPASLFPLLESLESGIPDVRTASLNALRAISGEDYDTLEQWRLWLSMAGGSVQ